MTGRLGTSRSVAKLLQATFRGSDTRLTAMLEIADRCNETCVHCYQVQGEKGELPTDDWRAIMDELAEMGVLFLTLSGGEATLRKDFLDLVAYARAKKFAVKLYTNGLSMTSDMAQRLSELAVQEVQISLYSHSAEAHDWTTGVPGSFERTVRGIRHLTDHGLRVVAKTPLMNPAADNMGEYIDFVESLGAYYAVDPNVSPREDGDRGPEALSATPAQLIGLLKDPRFSERHAEERAPLPIEGSPCAPCGEIHVEANGELRPCSALTVPLGNAVGDGVAASYATPEAAFIGGIRWADIRGCRVCDLRSYCNRCHSDAQMTAGDAFGPYTKACSRALVNYEGKLGVAPELVGSRAAASPAPALGPFRRLSPGRYEAFEDEFTQADSDLRKAHPWVASEVRSAAPAVVPGELVQLRRPGQRRNIAQPMPLGIQATPEPVGEVRPVGRGGDQSSRGRVARGDL